MYLFNNLIYLFISILEVKLTKKITYNLVETRKFLFSNRNETILTFEKWKKNETIKIKFPNWV